MCVVASSAQAVPTLLIDGGGQLIGADRVDVGGSLYDVRFGNGSCTGLFSGCNNAVDDFAFQTQAEGIVAAQALLDQVFIDNGSNLFDTEPETILGCSSVSTCQALIPVTLLTGGLLSNVITNNNNSIAGDTASSTLTLQRALSTASNGSRTYAVFTASASVPEPSVIALFSVGLLGTFIAGRRFRT